MECEYCGRYKPGHRFCSDQCYEASLVTAPFGSALDRAYARINALGGTVAKGDAGAAARMDMLDEVLDILIDEGARDRPAPATMADEYRASLTKKVTKLVGKGR